MTTFAKFCSLFCCPRTPVSDNPAPSAQNTQAVDPGRVAEQANAAPAAEPRSLRRVFTRVTTSLTRKTPPSHARGSIHLQEEESRSPVRNTRGSMDMLLSGPVTTTTATTTTAAAERSVVSVSNSLSYRQEIRVDRNKLPLAYKTLAGALDDPIAQAEFGAFLSDPENNGLNNLLFQIEYRRYIGERNGDGREDCLNSLFARFFLKGAPEELNFTAADRRKLMNAKEQRDAAKIALEQGLPKAEAAMSAANHAMEKALLDLQRTQHTELELDAFTRFQKTLLVQDKCIRPSEGKNDPELTPADEPSPFPKADPSALPGDNDPPPVTIHFES